MHSSATGFVALAVVGALATAPLCGGCGGSTDAGPGGTAGTGGTGGTGGGGPIEASCDSDSDCVAASLTSGPCYSPGCELPIAASKDDLARIACLKTWDGVQAPLVSDGCAPPPGDDVSCPAACAMPPTCVLAYCDAGACKLEMSQEANATCERPTGGGGDCADLDAAREEALEAARACVPDGDTAECGAGQTVADECGCPVLVNDAQPTLVSKAAQERLAWATACDPPERCSVIDCAGSQGSGTCVDDGTGAARCSWF